MKGALKRVFGSENVEKECNFDNSYIDSQIKQESVCYTQNLPNKRKENLIIWQNRELYLVVQFATQNVLGKRMST